MKKIFMTLLFWFFVSMIISVVAKIFNLDYISLVAGTVIGIIATTFNERKKIFGEEYKQNEE